MTEPTEDDARRFPRIGENCAVTYRVIKDEKFEAGAIDGSAVNISGGGICFGATEEMQSGAMVAIEIHLPNFPSTVVALGRVVWSKVNARTEQFDTGIEFWWIGWRELQAQEAMLDYVRGKLQGK